MQMESKKKHVGLFHFQMDLNTQGFITKNKGLVYDEFDSQGNKTVQTISKKILEDKIDNSIFEKLLKD